MEVLQMKKLIALLLTLALLLPAVSLGESETYTVDFDDFILTVSSDDIIQKGTKTEGGVVFMLYPDYDETSTSHPNISSAWTAEGLDGIDATTAPLFGAQVLQGIVDGLSAQNIVVTNNQLLDAQLDEETGSLTLAFAMDADYSGMGVDVQLAMYMVQVYIPLGEKGTYVFAITSDTMEGADAMLTYLGDNLAFKE